MKIVTTLLALFFAIGLMGCENEGTYQITGEECGPNDPVLTLDAADCTPI